MRHLLARAPLLAVALAWPLASISGCFNDVGGVTSAASGTTSGGSSGSASTGHELTSGSSSGGTTGGGVTSSGSSSAASTSAATAIETSGGATTGATTGGTTGGTSGTTGPEICTPDGDSCQICVYSACCDEIVACIEDLGCVCFVDCIGLGGDATQCSEECNVSLETGVTGELVLCTSQVCGPVCQGG